MEMLRPPPQEIETMIEWLANYISLNYIIIILYKFTN